MSKSVNRRLKKNHELVSRLIAKRQGSKGYDPLMLGESRRRGCRSRTGSRELKRRSVTTRQHFSPRGGAALCGFAAILQ